MSRRFAATVIACICAVLALSIAPRAQSSAAEIEFRQAVELERVKGQIAAAIDAYRKLAQSNDAKVAQQAREALARLEPTGKSPLSASGPFSSRSIDSLPDAVDFSADGSQAFYVKNGGSDPRPASSIVRRDLASGIEHALADVPAGQLTEVRVSPDGRWVARWWTAAIESQRHSMNSQAPSTTSLCLPTASALRTALPSAVVASTCTIWDSSPSARRSERHC
jgi:hypothetical protein